MAGLNNSFATTFESTGGIRTDSQNAIRIFGNVHKLFKLSSPAYVDKYTKLALQLEQIKPFQILRICLYKDENELTGNSTLLEDEKRCQDITRDGAVDIPLAEFFSFEITEVRFLSIFLESNNPFDSETVLSGFSLKRVGLDTYDTYSGMDCPALDANSAIFTDTSSSERKCVCKDGYVASNGGRFLDRYDTCVRTLFTSGGFDLSTCTYSRQCTSGTCYEGRCSPTGSLRLEINVAGKSFAIQGSELIRSNAVDEDGGVIMQPDSVLRIFGNTQQIFKMSQSTNRFLTPTSNGINVNKYTKLRFIAEVSEEVIRTRICLSNTADLKMIQDCPSSCVDIDGSAGETAYTIDVGEMFNDRMIEVNYIAFLQSSRSVASIGFESTSISDIQLVDSQVEDVIDADGRCSDPNSKRLRVTNQTDSDVCECLDGFVSSNGGKQRGVYDSCLGCLTHVDNACFDSVGTQCAMVSRAVSFMLYGNILDSSLITYYALPLLKGS